MKGRTLVFGQRFILTGPFEPPESHPGERTVRALMQSFLRMQEMSLESGCVFSGDFCACFIQLNGTSVTSSVTPSLQVTTRASSGGPPADHPLRHRTPGGRRARLGGRGAHTAEQDAGGGQIGGGARAPKEEVGCFLLVLGGGCGDEG